MVAGTFDLLHPGHVYLIERAAALGRVFVVVATDRNSRKFKGRPVIIPAAQRLAMVASLKGVESAILGDKKDVLASVKRLNPDIILLGPDQPNGGKLAATLAARGIKVKVLQLKKRFTGFPITSTKALLRKIKSP